MVDINIESCLLKLPIAKKLIQFDLTLGSSSYHYDNNNNNNKKKKKKKKKKKMNSINSLEFITELGNRLKFVTRDKLELTYLFQRLSIAMQRGNELCVNGTFVPHWYSYYVANSLSLSLVY